MRSFIMVGIAGVSMLLPAMAVAQSEQPASGAERRGPADLCQELLAFVRGPAEKRAAEGKSPPGVATAVEAPSQDEQIPVAKGGNDASQESAGMSGPVTPSGSGAPGPQGNAQEAPGSASSPQGATATPGSAPSADGKKIAGTAPGSVAPAPTKDPDAGQVEKVEAAARSHDIHQCRAAAQEMRRAGVTMPAPLLALAALDPKFFSPQQAP
jgi:hypothetical protein